MVKLVGMVAGIKINDEMWCISRILNGLYKMNIAIGKVNYVCDLPEKNEPDRQAYTDILSYNGKLYFIPAFAKNIAVYDVKLSTFSEINISNYFKKSAGEFNIGGGCIYGEWLYLYPCLSNLLIRINVQNGEVEINDSFIKNNNLKKDIFAYHKRHCQIGNKLYIALASYDGVLCIDMENYEYKTYSIPNNGSGYAAIIDVKDELWLAPHGDGAVVRYNMKSKLIEKLGEYPCGFNRSRGLAFSAFINCSNENLYLLPFAANMIIKVDIEKRIMQQLNIELSEPWLYDAMRDITSINIQSATKFDDKYYLFSESLNRMFIVSCTGEINEVEFCLEEYKSRKTDAIYIKECRGFALSDFLSYIYP